MTTEMCQWPRGGSAGCERCDPGGGHEGHYSPMCRAVIAAVKAEREAAVLFVRKLAAETRARGDEYRTKQLRRDCDTAADMAENIADWLEHGTHEERR